MNKKMKKKILMLLTLFVGVVNATADNTVSVGEALILQGKTGTFSIELTNTDAFASSMELHFTLPNGITFESVALSNRFTDNPTVGPSINGQAVTITTLSTTNAALSGNSGPLFYVTVSADEGLAVGEKLTASITKMELAKKVGSGHEKFNPEPFDFQIEITDKVILDENSPIAPAETDDEVDIIVKRTIKANQWSTICLPFDMTEEQVYAAFGDDVQLAEFESFDVETVGSDVTNITINFVECDVSDGFWGNTPYMIKTSQNISEFALIATLYPEDVEASYIKGTGSKRKKGEFVGTYQAETLVPDNSLFLNGSKFYYSTGKTKMKAFRCYFTLNKVLADVANASSRIAFSFDEATGVKELKSSKIEELKSYYNLKGQRVEKPVKKGLYIQNGKKVVIK